MKILMYGWEFPPLFSGGLGVACYAMVKALAKKGQDVTIVLPHNVENFIDRQRVTIVGCDTVVANIKRNAGRATGESDFNFSPSCFSTFLNPYLHLTESEYLAQINSVTVAAVEKIIAQLKTLSNFTSVDGLEALRPDSLAKVTGKYGMNLLAEVCHYAIIAGAMAAKIQHDVIHAHDWLTILAGIEAKKISGKPLIFHVHALETDRSGIWVDTRIFAIEKYGLEHADKIIAVSEYTKNILIEKYGISPHKIAIVHNGTDAVTDNDERASQLLRKRHKMVLFLGRLAEQKGPAFFVEIARKILGRRHDVHFVIAGTGGLLQSLIHKVASLRLGKYIHFTGFLDHQKIARIFRLADVYVMPSISEPFGISCLEALSYGVPVVISKQSGAAEVLPHVIKADFWDIDDMANKVVALLDYEALRRTTLQNSQENLRHLTWERAADSLIGIYSDCIYSARNVIR